MTSAYWIFGFIVAKTFNDLELLLNTSGCFWFYGAFCLAGFLFSLFFVPETKGKSSEEILRYFGGKANLHEDQKLGEGDHSAKQVTTVSTISDKPSISEGTTPEITSIDKIDEDEK